MKDHSSDSSFENDDTVDCKEEEWEDWEESNEEQPCTCLFSNDVCESVDDALRIDASSNGFDLKDFREKVGNDCACNFFFSRDYSNDIGYTCSYNCHFMIQYVW